MGKYHQWGLEFARDVDHIDTLRGLAEVPAKLAEADAEIEAKDREIRTWKDISTGLRLDMDDLRAKALKLADAVIAIDTAWRKPGSVGEFLKDLLRIVDEELLEIARELKGANG